MAITEAQIADLPEPQRAALESLFSRSGHTREEMLSRCYPPAGIAPYVSVVDFHGMFVGIEPDGYTHS